MPTEAKRETIDDLRAELDASRAMIVSEYRGLTVKEISEIRRALRKQNVTYRVVKNRLMRIARRISLISLTVRPRYSDTIIARLASSSARRSSMVSRLAAVGMCLLDLLLLRATGTRRWVARLLPGRSPATGHV